MRSDAHGGSGGDYPGWGDLAVIMAVFLASLLPAQLFLIHVRPADLGVFLGYIVNFSLSIAFVLWYMRVRGAPKPDIGLSLRGAVWGPAIWGFIAMAGVSVVIEPLLLLFPERHFEALGKITGMGIWTSLSAVVLAPVCEEVFFRGLAQGPMTRRFGARTAIIVSSLLFGVLHPIPPQAINAVAMGLILGYVYSRSGSLWPVVAIHLANNLVSLLQSGSAQGYTTTRELINNDAVYWPAFALAALLTLVAVRRMALYPETVIGREQSRGPAA